MKKFLCFLPCIILGMGIATATATAQKLSEKDALPQIKTNGLEMMKPTVAAPAVYEKSRDAIYSEDFESVPSTTLPQGWTTTANPADDIWLAGAVSSGSTPLPGHSGSKYMYLLYSASTAHNSWAFSPAVELTAGTSYNISFWVQLRAYRNIFEALEVKIGTAATAAEMTTLMYDENDADITAWQKVLYQFTPAASGTYYIGFHNYSPANSNAAMVDDIVVETTPAGPSFEGVSSVDFGDIYDIMPDKQATYTVLNTGTENLTVAETSTSPEITLEGASHTLEPGEAADITVNLNTATAGNYTGNFVLSTNDPSHTTVTVNVTATVLTGTLTEFHYQDFENGAPAGWTTTGFMPHAGSGIGGSASYRAAVAGYQPQFMTHFVKMGDDPVVNFSYKAINLAGQNVPTPANGLATLVYISDNYGASFTEIYRIEPGGANEHTPSLDYAEINIPLSGYAGKTCMIGVVSAGVGGTMYYMHIDNMRIGSKATDDLTALSLAGNTMPSVNAASLYTVTVENVGLNTQTGYTVKLMREGNEEIASMPGVSIAAGETKTFEMEWTPAAEGATFLYGEVVMDGDMDAANNRTENHNVTVQPEGITVVTVGTGKSLYYSPVNFYYKESASQALYFANEIGTNGGTIDRIMYQTAFNAEYTSNPFKLWIGETDRTDFTDMSWVDVSELTLVFDGILSQPAGDANWQIQFDEPFEYHGGNIVVYAVKTDTGYSVGKYFYSTLEPGAGRIIVSASDNSGTITEENPGAGQVALSDAYPNLFFFMNMDDAGSISGAVSNADGPVEGVKVEVAGTQLYAITNAEGEYEFASLVPDSYTLKATLFGYEDETASATVTVDSNTTVDFTMTETVEVTISGTVTRSDSGIPVDSATVTLSGYENYETVTDAEGIYTIEGVYGNHEYSMAVAAAGFVKYTATLAVAEENMTRDIEMNETPAPVQKLSAEENTDRTAVEVKWYEPGTFAEFRYDRGTIDGKLGLDNVYQNGLMGAVHREPAVLNEMSWYLSDEISGGAPHEIVDLYVLDLNSEGLPTSTVLYSATGVASTDAVWNLHTFPQPVNAPNGFMLAIGYPYGVGFLGLGLTNPTEEYPFVNNTQYFSSDYINGEFVSLELADLYANFMIRALGTVTGEAAPIVFNGNRTRRTASAEVLRYSASKPVETGAPAYSLVNGTPKALVDYSVYRLLEGQEQNETEWEVLSESLADTAYTDSQWATLESAVYRYAVKANYTNLSSAAVLSQPIAKKMEAAVTVNITTNSGDPVNGAVVTLTNQDGNTGHVYTETANSGTVTFPETWKGSYDLTVTLAGFEPHSETIVVNGDMTVEVELIETIVTPFGLLVEDTGNPADKLFSWNRATEKQIAYWDENVDYSNINALYQNLNRGYGVIYDLTAYPDAVLSTFDFYQSSWGVNGTWNYKLRIVDVDAGEVIYTSETLQTTGNDTWEEGIDLNATEGLGGKRIGVFLEAMSGADGDAYPCFTSDEMTENAHSYFLDLTTLETVLITTQQGPFSEYLMNLWILTAEGKVKISNGTKSLTGYTVYLNDEETASGITDTQHLFEGLENGTYKAGVKAIFSSGESEIAYSAPFTVNVPDPEYTVTFTVTNEDGEPVEDATIVFNGETLDGYIASGIPACEYDYTVSKTGYTTATGTVEVIDQNVTEEVTLGTVGIDDNTLAGITVYGNEGSVYIVNKNNIVLKSVQITDGLGRIVYDGRGRTFSTLTEEIPVNGAGGIYIVRVVSEDGKVLSAKVHLDN